MTGHSANGHVVIAGGSGFVGTALAEYLTAKGTPVVVLSRREPKATGPWQHVPWDGRTVQRWSRVLEDAAGLINLAGRSVDCVKTPDHQDEILRSRVESTRVLGEAVRTVERPPPVWVQMSTAHIYGDPPEAVCTEDSPFGVGLAPYVGRAWEEAFAAAVLPSQRPVVLRTSFVLGRDRGAGSSALAKMRTATRLGLGGRIGSGRQGISWIHEVDLHRIFHRALTDPSLQGAYIASSPHPVSQAEFMRALRQTVGGPIGLPAPAWLARFGVRWVLQSDPELALYGRYVIPQRLLDAQFEFRFPQLGEALRDLLGRPQHEGRRATAAVHKMEPVRTR
ncbi:MAG: TIGR01777 family oxidoreductase [Pirellulales bacterium]